MMGVKASQTHGSIYLIRHLESGRGYVGQTRRKPEVRWRHHWQAAADVNCQNYLAKALRKYGREAFEFSVIEVCRVELLNEREVFWVQELATMSPNGFNLKAGGGTTIVVAPEVGQKIGLKVRGKKHNPHNMSPEGRAAISAARRRNGNSEECRRKISENQRGKKRGPRSEETKAKLRVALTGRAHSEERRAAIRLGMAAMSDEARAVMLAGASRGGQTMKGHVWSDETNARRSQSMTGKTLSETAKLKISLASRERTWSAETRMKYEATIAVRKNTLISGNR